MYQSHPELWPVQPPANLAGATLYTSQSQDYNTKYVTQTVVPRKVQATTPQRQSLDNTLDIRDPQQKRDVTVVAAMTSEPSPIATVPQSPADSLNLSQFIAEQPDPNPEDSMLKYLTEDANAHKE